MFTGAAPLRARSSSAQPALTNGSSFAFASTLAIYQYDGGCQLQRMLALHQNHISCWAWCPADAELYAVATKHKAGGGAACCTASRRLVACGRMPNAGRAGRQAGAACRRAPLARAEGGCAARWRCMQAAKVYRAGHDEPIAATKNAAGDAISGLHW
jgi:hypothetical protein